jgi:pimeloyl-ACP methyl ester carboxylesterase
MALRKRYWIPGVFVLLIAALGFAFYLRPVEFFNAQVRFQMRAIGIESHSVTVSGYKVHYIALGPEKGLPVVLVHGLGGHVEDWRNLMPYFAASGFRVYALDLPGYGESEQPKDFSYSVADEANIVVGFLDALGLKQVDLAGHSMGGWIVQLVAFHRPERIRRLMIFDSVGLHELPTWDTNLFTPTNDEELYQLTVLLIPNPPRAPEFIAKDILRISAKNAWVIHRALAEMLNGQNVTDEILPQLKMPVLLVWGDLDRTTPLSLGEKMHALVPQSKLEIAKGCGHLAPTSCTEQIGPMVQSFLK